MFFSSTWHSPRLFLNQRFNRSNGILDFASFWTTAMGQSTRRPRNTFSESLPFDVARYVNHYRTTMARRVFFSFHYGRDLWRVNVVRNSGAIEGISAAGFHDESLWEETTKEGDDAVRKLINKGLEGTSVTVVLICAQTANRKYVSYEIERSVA